MRLGGLAMEEERCAFAFSPLYSLSEAAFGLAGVPAGIKSGLWGTQGKEKMYRQLTLFSSRGPLATFI